MQSVFRNILILLPRAMGGLTILLALLILAKQSFGLGIPAILGSGDPDIPLLATLTFLLSGGGLLAVGYRRVVMTLFIGLALLPLALLSFVTEYTSRTESLNLPITSLAFLLAAISLIALSHNKRTCCGYLAGLTGSSVAMLGAIALLDSLVDLHSLYGWWPFASLAPMLAAGLIVLGFGLVTRAHYQLASEIEDIISWVRLVSVSGLLLLSLFLWDTLHRLEERSLLDRLAIETRAVAQNIEMALNERLNAIDRMALRWEAADGTSRELWERDARAYLHDLPGGFFGIRWADPDGVVRWAVPEGVQQLPTGLDLTQDAERADALHRARQHHQPVFGFVEHLDGLKGLVLVRSLNVAERHDGYLVAAFRGEELLATMSAEALRQGFGLETGCRGRVIYQAGTPLAAEDSKWFYDVDFNIGPCEWRIRLWPTAQLQAKHHTYLPDLVLIAGILFALLTGVLFWLWRQSRRRELEAEQARAKAEAAELQQRLAATVFEKSQEGVTIADAQGNIIKVNRAFTEITGYPPEEVIGKNPRILQSGRQDKAFYQQMWQAIHTHGHWRGDIWNRRKNGEIYPEILSITKVRDAQGNTLNYLAVFTDISEHKAMEESLLKAKEEAEQANRTKSEFLASMSHELRTPLNAILGFAQLFSLDSGLSAQSRDHAREIERAGNHLLALINDLIDLSRIEAGKLSLSMETVAVHSVIEEALTMVSPLAQDRGIRLINEDGEGELATVQADYVRLRQVLINLLSNAIKYNREQGEVRLRCLRKGGQVHISIQDTGHGIPAVMQARLFTMFDRLGAERGRAEGSGIGLFVTRHIIEAMGGQIGFSSREGSGSTFWVELPCTGTTTMPEEAQPNQEMVSSPSSQQHRILHIEDNPMNQRLMRQVFARYPDIELSEAHSAEIGLQMARQQPPDLILMDINLPGIDGFTALQQLQQDPATAAIPVIAISANAMKGDAERGLAAGFVNYVTKPIDIPRLLEAIDHILPSTKIKKNP